MMTAWPVVTAIEQSTQEIPMYKSLPKLMTAAVASAFFFAGSAALAEEASSQKDLNEFVCKDIMRLSGSERENALALAHGYRLGKMSTTKYNIDDLAALTERFIDYCLDHPNDKALATFEKLGK
jgi:hypothetical protein